MVLWCTSNMKKTKINMNRYVFALDLKDNPKLIAQYKKHHQNVWKEVIYSIKESGIENMEIYLLKNRLFMIIEANDNFSLEQKNKNDLNNPIVQKWEKLMWNYQKALPWAKPNQKWLLMKKIFTL